MLDVVGQFAVQGEHSLQLHLKLSVRFQVTTDLIRREGDFGILVRFQHDWMSFGKGLTPRRLQCGFEDSAARSTP